MNGIPPYSYEQAVKLRDSGAISQATFDRIFPETAPQASGGASGAVTPSVGASPQAEPSQDAKNVSEWADLGSSIASGVKSAYGVVKDVASTIPSTGDTMRHIARGTPLPSDPQASSLPAQNGAFQTADLKTTDQSAQVQLASDTIQSPGAAEANPMGADPFKPLTAGFDLQQAAIKEASKVGEAKAAEENAYLTRVAKENDDRIKTNEMAQAARQAKVDEAAAKLQEAQASLNSMQVDPNRYWANKGTGDKVLAGIGLFLGAFGQGGNKAVAVIQDAIDKDIAAQKANIETKKAGVAVQSGILSDMRARFQDQRVAEEAARVAYLDNAQLKIKAISSKYSGQEVAAKADMLIGELEQKKIEAKANFLKAFQSSMPVTPDMEPERMTQDQRDRFVPGYGLALDKETAKTLRTQVSNATNARRELGRLLEIAEMDGKSLSPELVAEAGTRANMLTGLLKEDVVGPGTISDKDRELLQEVARDPTKFTNLDKATKSRLRTAMDVVQKNLAERVRMAGLSDPRAKLGFTTAGK